MPATESNTPWSSPTVWLLLLFPFVMLGGYAVARPSVEALFVATYTAKAMPYGWIATAFTAFAVVTAYNRALGRYSLGQILVGANAIIGVLLVVLWSLSYAKLPGAPFVLYVWKDTYVVVLTELFWSFANSKFQLKSARFLYGAFCASGALGGVAGAWVSAALADGVGNLYSPPFVLPTFVICALIGVALQRTGDVEQLPEDRRTSSFKDGVEVLRKSDYLVALLVVICLIQVVVNLVDYQFNVFSEQEFPHADERQKMVSMVYGAIEGSAFILQVGTFLVVRALGVGGTLLAVPTLLGGGLVLFLVTPAFWVMGVVKAASKSLDYSLNRAVKEMLYLPLSPEEKTSGKSIVDMLTYRMSKGVASVLVIVTTHLGLAVLELTWLNLALVGVWMAMIVVVVRNYRRVIEQQSDAELAAKDAARPPEDGSDV